MLAYTACLHACLSVKRYSPCHAYNTTLPRHGTRSHSKNHSNGKRLKLPRLFCLPLLMFLVFFFVSRSQFTFQLFRPPFSLCYPLPPLPPSARRLFALRYQRISELRHEAPRNFNTSLAAWESPFTLSPLPASCHICTACPEFIMAYSERYVCGSYICSATRSLATVYGLLVNCRRQMLMSPY